MIIKAKPGDGFGPLPETYRRLDTRVGGKGFTIGGSPAALALACAFPAIAGLRTHAAAAPPLHSRRAGRSAACSRAAACARPLSAGLALRLAPGRAGPIGESVAGRRCRSLLAAPTFREPDARVNAE